jgi:HSP20 family molecular chaperone IbpA
MAAASRRCAGSASEVDEAKSGAKYQDGILVLTLPEKTTTSSGRLPIA